MTHLGAHDSPFLRNQATSFSTSGNHFYNTTVQLESGVRMLSAQVHQFNNSGTVEWHLCHTSCNLLDAGTLTNWLQEIKTWMDAHPNDVVTLLIVNSDDADAATLGSQFAASGIDQLAYTPPSLSSPPTQWPTLSALISNRTRLLTFVASLAAPPSPQYPYLMDEFTFLFENPFENTTPATYACNPDRPTSLRDNPLAAAQSDRLFLMNHMLYTQQSFGIQTTNLSYANRTNAQTGEGSLGAHIKNCSAVYGGAKPVFVLVDWSNLGPAIASVDEANGVSDPVGRLSLPTVALAQTGSAVGRTKGNMLVVVVVVVVALVVAGGFAS
ncbi:hypothetical protein ACEQ8H_005096 [Pleosporales sp. CAS-2024a]